MKKFTTVFSLLVIVAGSVTAQITLTQTNMPAVGDKFITVYDSSGTVTSPGGSGPSQTWNFSTMNAKSPDTATGVSPASTPVNFASQCPSANVAFKLSVKAGEYEYLNSTASGLYLDGVVANTTTYGQVLYKYNPTWDFIALPATYKSKWGGTYTSTMKTAYAVTGYDSIGEISIATYHDTVDSWGTMTTPTGTYNVLRIKHTETDKDSTILHSTSTHSWMGFPSSTTYNYYYAWYTNTANYFLVQMMVNNSTGAIIQTEWLKNAPAGIDEVTNNDKVMVYPNPANYELNIVTVGYEQGSVKIFDMAGKEIESTTLLNGRAQIKTSHFADGMYIYSIVNNDGQVLRRDKFTVDR
jgi:hypothetical protein